MNCPQATGSTGSTGNGSSSTTGSPTTTLDPTTLDPTTLDPTTLDPTTSTTDPTTSTTDPTTGGTSTGGSSSTTTDTGSSSTTAPLPGCGDLVVDPGEECDDGNLDDTDACTNACMNAACGDGIVGPGEACDDGNKDDADACSNDCALGSCGDGKVQVGEACDDGNKVDTDACLSTCVAASCGDMVVQAGVEGCDDANDDETDACTSQCQPPTCVDKARNGAETDTDCGGGVCPKCAVDQACKAVKDCASALCTANVCVLPTSCMQIKTADAAAPSGIYTIDADGKGVEAPIKVHCDQVTDGGGWTMLFKLSAGVAGDPSVLWNGPAVNESDETLLNTMKSAKHYVSGYLGKFWNMNGVVLTEARVHVYTGNAIAKFWKYDTALTTKINWYASAKLKGSSYNDLVAPFNFYSILGEDTAGRRFYINRSYAGCGGDAGWLNVDTAPDPCAWEVNNAAAIRILYAAGQTVVTWDAVVNAKTIGVGDVFAVFVR